jgi:hypothetical protein
MLYLLSLIKPTQASTAHRIRPFREGAVVGDRYTLVGVLTKTGSAKTFHQLSRGTSRPSSWTGRVGASRALA